MFVLALAEGGASGLVQFVPFLLVFAIFYFLLLAPMRKRQKALQQTIENLKKGDKVITTGGLHGEIAAIEGTVLFLKLSENVKVRVSKSAVAGLESGEEGAGK